MVRFFTPTGRKTSVWMKTTLIREKQTYTPPAPHEHTKKSTTTITLFGRGMLEKCFLQEVLQFSLIPPQTAKAVDTKHWCRGNEASLVNTGCQIFCHCSAVEGFGREPAKSGKRSVVHTGIISAGLLDIPTELTGLIRTEKYHVHMHGKIAYF